MALPLSAFSDQGLYIQLQGNKVFPMDIDASASDSDGDSLSGEIDYDESFTPGIEIGMKAIGDSNFRAGLQYIAPEFEFNNAKVTSATIGGVNYAADLRLDRSELTSGNSLDADAKMLMINGYYDFAGHWESFVPFVGVGVGMVDFDKAKDKEFGYAAMIGFKKYITDSKQLYIGHKSSFTRVQGPELRLTDINVNLDDVDFYTATFQLGYEF